MYSLFTILHSAFLYFIGFGLGILSVPIFVKQNLITEEESKRIDDYYNKLFLEFMFIEELEEAPMSTLSEEELSTLKNEVLFYEIPYVFYKVHMFYDSEKKAFCYFASNDLAYKYVDIVCRRYVLEHKCKQVYLFPEEATDMDKTPSEQSTGPFVIKKDRTFLQKEMNKIIYMGKHVTPEPTTSNTKPLSFLQFKFLKRA